jgi:hypothetical protein
VHGPGEADRPGTSVRCGLTPEFTFAYPPGV